MIIAVMLAAATPVAVAPVQSPICKVVKDHPLKSRRAVACGTADEWKAYETAYRAAAQKKQRRHIAAAGAYAGVGSGY